MAVTQQNLFTLSHGCGTNLRSAVQSDQLEKDRTITLNVALIWMLAKAGMAPSLRLLLVGGYKHEGERKGVCPMAATVNNIKSPPYTPTFSCSASFSSDI